MIKTQSMGRSLVALIWLPCAAWAADGTVPEKCTRSFGTLAVAEPQAGLNTLSQYGLGSPAALLRMMVQNSGCFEVVERGAAMQNLQQERALGASGDLRQESNLGKGQLQAADFVMTPNVQIGAQTTGGLGGSLLGKLGVLGQLAGGLKFKEASTSLLIADVRSSIQVAAAEGKASKTDFSLGGWAIGGGAAAGAAGYTSSPEGKVVAASFLDNFNKIVLAIRDQPQLIKPSSAAGDANAAVSTRADAPQQAGQMLQAKIANVKAYAEPSRDSAVVATLQRTDELVATGEVKSGFVKVDSANFSGWVQRTLVGPIPGAAQPVAAAPVPLVSAVPAANYRYGNFVGSVDGAEKGSFRIFISDKGDVSGDGSFSRSGAFGLAGKYEPSEERVGMYGSSAAGMMLFNGRFDAARGEISGVWSYGTAMGAPLGPGGSFSARRQ